MDAIGECTKTKQPISTGSSASRIPRAATNYSSPKWMKRPAADPAMVIAKGPDWLFYGAMAAGIASMILLIAAAFITAVSAGQH